MDKVEYVEKVFAFIFKNAKVFESVTKLRKPSANEQNRLVTLIEAVRFEAMHPPPPDEPFEVNLSAYDFSEVSPFSPSRTDTHALGLTQTAIAADTGMVPAGSVPAAVTGTSLGGPWSSRGASG